MNDTEYGLARIRKLSQVVMLSAVLGMASSQASAGDALIQGYGLGLAASGVALGIAAIIVAVLVNARKGQVSTLGDSPLH